MAKSSRRSFNPRQSSEPASTTESTSTSLVRLRAPERSLTLDTGRSKCPATAARTALLAAHPTGDALTHNSSRPSFQEDLKCDARGCTRTVTSTPIQPYPYDRRCEPLSVPQDPTG